MSGDEVRLETQDAQAHTMEVRSEQAGVSCEPRSIEVPRSGLGLSVPLVCTTDASVTLPYIGIVTVEDPEYHQTLTLEVRRGLHTGRRLAVPDRPKQHAAGPLDRLQQRHGAAVRTVRG